MGMPHAEVSQGITSPECGKGLSARAGDLVPSLGPCPPAAIQDGHMQPHCVDPCLLDTLPQPAAPRTDSAGSLPLLRAPSAWESMC